MENQDGNFNIWVYALVPGDGGGKSSGLDQYLFGST